MNLSPKTISDKGLDHIRKFEGFRACPYQDAAGVWTIGCGHTGPDVGRDSLCISETEAENLLREDVRSAEGAVNRHVNVPLSQDQFDALVSFTYNLGGGALERSTLLDKINARDYEGAAQEFPRWVYAGGRKLDGLVRRRKAEERLFRA